MFQASTSEFRSFEASLDFFSVSLAFIPRHEIRDKYLPCLLENLKSSNYNIKQRIIDIIITMLTKTADFPSR